jgi:hypothetical protein
MAVTGRDATYPCPGQTDPDSWSPIPSLWLRWGAFYESTRRCPSLPIQEHVIPRCRVFLLVACGAGMSHQFLPRPPMQHPVLKLGQGNLRPKSSFQKIDERLKPSA